MSDKSPAEYNSALLSLVRTGDWLDEQEFAATEWAVPSLIPEGFGLLTGPPKAGKSWAVLGIALAVAEGGTVLGGIEVDARPVLYLALEDGDKRLQKRCRKLLNGASIPPDFHHVTQVPPVPVTELLRAWVAQHADHKPLVVLDTLGKVMPPSTPGESAYSRDYRVGSGLKSIVDEHPGSALLVVHHTRKAEGADWMDSTSGTQGLNGAADFTINLSRRRNEDEGIIRVTGRDVEEAEYAVVVTDGAWSLSGADLADAARKAQESRDAENIGDLSARVLEFVNAADNPVNAATVNEALGIDRANTYLNRLFNSGRIARPSRGHYSCVSSVSSVSTDHPFDTHDTLDTPTYGSGELDEDGFLLRPNLSVA